MKRLWNALISLAFVILFSAAAYFHFGTPPLTAIPSQSMLPTLHVGDLVVVKKTNPQFIEKGDIVIVSVPELVQKRFGYPKRIIHRVVEVHANEFGYTYRTKGDNANTQDPFTITPEQIIGEAGKVFRYLGYPVLFLNSPQGIAFLLALLVLYFIYAVTEWARRRDFSLRRAVAFLLFREMVERLDRIEELERAILRRLGEEREKEAAVSLEEQDDLSMQKSFPPRSKTRRRKKFFRK